MKISKKYKALENNRGFTKVELIVVIVICAILGGLLLIGVGAGLLLPALAKSKTKSQGIQCLYNNNQLILAWSFYTVDNDGKLVGAAEWNFQGEKIPDWTGGSMLTQKDKRDPNNWNNSAYTFKSPLWPYCDNNPEIWKCPADRSTAIDSMGETVPRIRSRSMNNWVGGPGWDDSGPWHPQNPKGWRTYVSETDFVDPGPSQTFVLVDEHPDNINDGYFVVDMKGYPDNLSSSRMVDFPASYHKGAAGFAFADGHAEIKKWLDKRTKTPPLNMQDRPLNVSMPNNPDLRWMQERSTRKVN